MDELEIVKYPSPILTAATTDLQEITGETVTLATNMFEAMYRAKGLGLAAPQVGSDLRITVINLSNKEEDEQVLINPYIIAQEDQELGEEGCLSFPGILVKIPRAKWVKVRAYNLDGNEFDIEGEGLAARALQHEIDHLDGVLFLSKFSPTQRIGAGQKLKEFEREFRDAK